MGAVQSNVLRKIPHTLDRLSELNHYCSARRAAVSAEKGEEGGHRSKGPVDSFPETCRSVCVRVLKSQSIYSSRSNRAPKSGPRGVVSCAEQMICICSDRAMLRESNQPSGMDYQMFDPLGNYGGALSNKGAGGRNARCMVKPTPVCT